MNQKALLDASAGILILIILFAVPVACGFMFFDSYIIKLWLTEILCAALLMIFFVQLYDNEISSMQNSIYIWALFLYLLICFFSYLTIHIPQRYILSNSVILLITGILLCILCGIYVNTDFFRVWTGKVIIFSSIPVNVFALWHYIAGKRIIGSLGNENFLGGYLVSVISLLFVFIIYYFRKIIKTNVSNKKKTVFYHGVLLACLIYIMCLSIMVMHLTKCRGGLVAAGLSSFLIVLFIFIKKNIRIYVISGLVIAICILIILPISRKFLFTFMSMGVRPHIWLGSLSMFFEKFLLGWGYGSFYIFYPIFRIHSYWLQEASVDLTKHAHCEYLEILTETGLIGLTVFLLIIGLIIWRVGRKLWNIKLVHLADYVMIGIYTSFIGFLTHNLVSVNMRMYSGSLYFWIFAGLLTGFDRQGFTTKLKVRKFVKYFYSIILISMIFYVIWGSVVKPAVSHYYFQKGKDFRNVDNKKVLQFYSKAVDWYYYDPEMHYRYAYAYYINGMYKKAMEEYKIVRCFSPYYGNVLSNMALVYHKIGNERLALQYTLLSLKMNPYHLPANRLLLKLQKRLNKEG